MQAITIAINTAAAPRESSSTDIRFLHTPVSSPTERSTRCSFVRHQLSISYFAVLLFARRLIGCRIESFDQFEIPSAISFLKAGYFSIQFFQRSVSAAVADNLPVTSAGAALKVHRRIFLQANPPCENSAFPRRRIPKQMPGVNFA